MSFVYNRSSLQIPESWWKWAQASQGVERYRYIEDFFHRLGWKSFIPLPETEIIKNTGTFPFLLTTAKGKGFYIAIVPDNLLHVPSRVKNDYLDFCPVSRLLIDEFSGEHSPYLLITDFGKFHFYSIPEQTLLLWADYPAQFQAEIAPLLFEMAIDNGSLDEIPQIPKSTMARELREWNSSWVKKLMQFSDLPEEKTNIIIDRLFIIHHVFSNKIFWKTREFLEERLLDLIDLAITQQQSAGIGEALISLFHDMWFDWRINVFQIDTEIDRVLSEDEIATELLYEYPLLSPKKFETSVMLESFNYGDALERMRIRMIPEPNPDREAYLHTQTKETIDQAQIEVDISEEGYRAILFWFDRLIKCYEMLEEKEMAKLPPAENVDDLWTWGHRNNDIPMTFRNKIQQACLHGFRIYYQNARQLRIARLLLTIHLIQLYSESKHPLEKFPSMEHIFVKKPEPIPSERSITRRLSS
ncbi:MAG TPA: hypothetical protein PLT82_08040 [Candidatus Hydrogenedens sp.]|nr:hypothetical protein [Candidatus Hydrogenedens sp.]